MIRKMIAVDWRAMRSYHVELYLLSPVLILMVAFFNQILVIPASVLIWLSFSLNPFNVEEKGVLNSLYLTLPVKRKAIVTGRYALSLIILVCGILMGLAFMQLTNRYSLSIWIIDIRGYITVISLSYFLYSFSNLLMFPILFRFGGLKSKIWWVYLSKVFNWIAFIVIFIVVCLFITVISSPGYEDLIRRFISYASENMFLVNGVMIILATMLLLLSYMLSIRLYSKRDF